MELPYKKNPMEAKHRAEIVGNITSEAATVGTTSSIDKQANQYTSKSNRQYAMKA